MRGKAIHTIEAVLRFGPLGCPRRTLLLPFLGGWRRQSSLRSREIRKIFQSALGPSAWKRLQAAFGGRLRPRVVCLLQVSYVAVPGLTGAYTRIASLYPPVSSDICPALRCTCILRRPQTIFPVLVAENEGYGTCVAAPEAKVRRSSLPEADPRE